jgi:hypothetical protein
MSKPKMKIFGVPRNKDSANGKIKDQKYACKRDYPLQTYCSKTISQVPKYIKILHSLQEDICQKKKKGLIFVETNERTPFGIIR